MRNSAFPAWLICLCLSLTVIYSQVSHADEQDETYELMRLFVDTFEEIDSNYVKDLDRRELVEAGIAGMLAKLDPYSNYISPEDLAGFEQDVQQEFGGIGIQVHFDNERREIVVMTPLPGTPAYEAGVRAGDRIINIEGTDVAEFELGKELATAVKLLKGPAGVKVKVTVRHLPVETDEGETASADQQAESTEVEESADGENSDEDNPVSETKQTLVDTKKEDVETLEIERAIIKVATVMGDRYNSDGSWDFMLDPEQKIGYIRLSHFSRNSANEMHAALKELEKQGMKGLILDLRWNPGGLLTSATEISDMFVESGKIVSTKGRHTPERIWRAKKRGTFTDFPMAVLINRYSASASEIVSACLQDHDRAVVVGERSWGKGSVQNVIELEEGASALKLTTASYHRPSGKNIHRFPKAKTEDEWGVLPNEGYKVEFTVKQMLEYRVARSERDVLSEQELDASDFVDTQLEKAISVIEEGLSRKAGDQKAKEAGAPGKSVGKEAAYVPRSFFVVPSRDVL